MKIRIKGNTLRLRLTQSELKELDQKGSVSETISFAPGQMLVYTLEQSATAREARAVYDHQRIRVVLPAATATGWIRDEQQVSITDRQDNGSEEGLSLLIEKDFRCLTERTHEDEEDLFPHPKEDELEC